MSLPDGLREALGQVIADQRREWRRERELIEAQSRQVIAELRAQIVELRAQVNESVAARLATLKDGEPGQSVVLADVEPMIAAAVSRAVEAIPRPKDGEPGTSVEVAAVEAMVAEAVAAIPKPKDGGPGEVDMVAVEAMVEASVGRAVAALPPPEVAPLVDEAVARAVSALPPAKEGPAGKLPMVEEWKDRVYQEAEAVTFEGATYQALRLTGKPPSHEDWRCIARAGRDGIDGRSLNPRSTWSAAETYARLDVVALEGGAFVARRDDPGPCPGDGWQLIAMRGKPGRPGDKGESIKGNRGDAGPGVVAIDIDAQGVVTITNGDGTTATGDFYPVLSQIAR